MGRSRTPPPEWATIQTCAILNRALNVTTITPWNLGEVPEHWIEMIVSAKSLEAELLNAGKAH